MTLLTIALTAVFLLVSLFVYALVITAVQQCYRHSKKLYRRGVMLLDELENLE